ncbi:MAG: winged helix-turn-helix domain-containing protein [Aestuariivirga sp.]
MSVHVEPKVLNLIVNLIERRDRMVSKDELVAAVWQGRIISDAAISSAVSAARRVLRDDGQRQRYIRTIHGCGFRFVGSVIETASGVPGPSLEASGTAAPLGETRRPPSAAGGPAAVARGAQSSSEATSPYLNRRTWPCVAVLPLRLAGDDHIASEIADALTEDLAACLSRDRSLAVMTPHDNSFDSNGLPSDVRQLAGQMDAQYIVDGGVRHMGGSPAVTLRLIDGVDGRLLWVERRAPIMDGLPTLDDVLARRFAATIRTEIEANETTKAEVASGDGLDFHAAYWKGSRELYRFTHESLVNARAYFAKAIQQNPMSASAHARLSYVDIQLYWYGSAEARDTVLRRAMTGAGQAVALDPKNALGRMSLGRAWALSRKFDDAIPELEAAVGLDPSLAQLHFALGQTLCYAGQAKDAVRLLDAAVELNPHDPHRWTFLHDRSEAQFALGSLANAERDARAAARAPNATHWPWVTLAAVLGVANRPEQAQEALRGLLYRRPDYSLSTARKDLSHFSDPSFVDLYVEGLRRAGLRRSALPTD